ncbi:hypothetical protein BD311DRAFT_752871 [Dichomitus squalens]|uniref:Uncharacterized protein n=1 Tax=Dichomitus squalens TaxID=114155 RepID=A0A4Q9MTR0_9APHY|nr:hypothetical protein BD311DRAFT_752871 [Dichomitus squalens]
MARDAESSRKVLGPIAIRLTAATPGKAHTVCRAESVYKALPTSPSTLRTGFLGITNLA